MSSEPAKPDPSALPLSALPFEEAMRQLEAIVTELERGDVGLEKSIGLYEQGEALKRRCEALLKEAEMRIEKITLRADGTPKGTEPLDP